jgi:Mn2+/Fe2+ NRAMP family transporter
MFAWYSRVLEYFVAVSSAYMHEGFCITDVFRESLLGYQLLWTVILLSEYIVHFYNSRFI